MHRNYSQIDPLILESSQSVSLHSQYPFAFIFLQNLPHVCLIRVALYTISILLLPPILGRKHLVNCQSKGVIEHSGYDATEPFVGKFKAGVGVDFN